MPELETALRELARELDFPPTPELGDAVRARLGRRRAPWRPIAIALAILAVAVGAVLAVPPARTAILDWLGLEGVEIVRVDELPEAPVAGHLDLGREVTLDQARREAPWLLIPSDRPEHVYVSRSIPGGKVTLLWGTPTNVRLLLSQFRGRLFLEKIVTPEAGIERVRVGSSPGVWLPGPHVVLYRDRDGRVREQTSRLVGDTLVWQAGDRTLRLEGALSKDDALRIARSTQP